MSNNSHLKTILGSVAEQRELFLLKFPDIDRIDVIDMYEAFVKFDKKKMVPLKSMKFS